MIWQPSLSLKTTAEMGSILHYIWSKGALPKTGLQTTDGKDLHIMLPGNNSASEPNLFKGAKIEIEGRQMRGSVMLHNDASEEELDLFSCNSNNSPTTILHVSLNDAYTVSHEDSSTLRVSCPKELIEEYNAAKERSGKFPCESTITGLSTIDRENILNALIAERLDDKKEIIERIFRQCEQRWDETLLKTTIRSFGFGIQSDIFEKWANLLNANALGKHSDNATQIEAIFFGQAGLLNDESIPYYYRNEATQNNYYNELKREYDFLSNKFNLESLDYRMWGNSNSSPHLRIARLTTLYHLGRLTMSGITSAQTLTELYRLFNHSLSGYWQNHTCFGGTETCGNGCMRQKQVDIIIINSVIPMLYIYGKHRKNERLCKRAIELLHEIDSEENSIIKRWREQGVIASCAADSQALLQLHRNYCRENNCTDCHFAFHYIKNRL